MTDRSRTHSSRPRAQQPTMASASQSSSNVRRNLFQNQLSRRPTAGTSNSEDSLRLEVDVLSDAKIVVRDENGEIELGDPPSPVLEDEDEVQLEDRQENEKERQRLSEAVKHHRINHNTVPNQPEELLEAVRTSLRAKVAALTEDNWMFGREEPPRG